MILVVWRFRGPVYVLSRLWRKKIAIRLLLYIQDNVTLIVFLNKN
ncbi:hypothetical protein [Escherichia coli]|nr:hypothetical protein [Escherichia coli]